MARVYFNQAIECLPMAGIIELQKQNLLKSDLIHRALASALYADAWRRQGVSDAPIEDRAQLTTLPYLEGEHIRQAFARHTPAELVNFEKTRIWSCTSGSTGKSKWIPYSDADLELFSQAIMRALCQQAGQPRAHRVLSLTSPAPFISDLLSNLAMMTHTGLGLEREVISVGLSDVEPAVELARRRGVDVLIAFPSVAMKMAEEIELHIKDVIERRWHETRNPKWLAARLYFKINKPRAQNVLALRYGLFSGESIQPYREFLKRSFGLEPYETYTLTEFPCLNVDCERHDGIHIWSDLCVPELIPDSELEKEADIPGYIPKAAFLDQAHAGTRGEYVVTTFSQALPLVRYRTADMVQVVSNGICGCGRTHPRIRVLYRLDDIVNMGLIRFSTQEVENAMAGITRHAKVRGWQIELKREGYKPSPRLIVECSGVTDPDGLITEIRDGLYRIDILKLGIDAGLILPPDIVINAGRKPGMTASGKTKRIVYDASW